MKKHILFAILFLPMITSAQLPEYFVYLVKGPVTVKKGSAKAKTVKPLALIYADDVLQLKSNSEITITNKANQYITLNTAGTYKVAELDKKLVKDGHSIMGKFAHLVWEEVGHAGKDYSTFKAKNMGTWGGVVRSVCVTKSYPFINMVLTADSLSFEWKPEGAAANYELRIMNASGAMLLKQALKDTAVTIAISQLGFTTTTHFSWTVENLTDPCRTPPAYKAVWMPKAAYDARVKEISSGIAVSKGSPAHFIKIAEELEKEGFYDAAAENLVKAMGKK